MGLTVASSEGSTSRSAENCAAAFIEGIGTKPCDCLHEGRLWTAVLSVRFWPDITCFIRSFIAYLFLRGYCAAWLRRYFQSLIVYLCFPDLCRSNIGTLDSLFAEPEIT